MQWMAGRTFSRLEECTIIWPHYPEALAPGGGVDLPACTNFTYDDHIIDTLPNFRIPKLDTRRPERGLEQAKREYAARRRLEWGRWPGSSIEAAYAARQCTVSLPSPY